MTRPATHKQAGPCRGGDFRLDLAAIEAMDLGEVSCAACGDEAFGRLPHPRTVSTPRAAPRQHCALVSGRGAAPAIPPAPEFENYALGRSVAHGEHLPKLGRWFIAIGHFLSRVFQDTKGGGSNQFHIKSPSAGYARTVLQVNGIRQEFRGDGEAFREFGRVVQGWRDDRIE